MSPDHEACEWIVDDEGHGLEAVEFLSRQNSSLSKKSIKQSVDRGEIFVNGARLQRGNRLLARGDRVRMEKLRQGPARLARLIYEDDFLWAISKPPGVVVSPRDLEAALGSLKSIARPLFLVHRLDQETSGVLLIAKSEEVQKKLEDLFRHKEIEKQYLALVSGSVSRDRGVIEFPLVMEQKGDGREARVRIGSMSEPNSRSARTDWEVLKRSPLATLVRLFPKTGRTHQIRVHMSAIGHPLIGEKKYNTPGRDQQISASRHLLHAESLRFIHPVTKKECFLYDPISEDFSSAIAVFLGVDASICALS